jgi:hypothetical protein
MHRVRAPLTPAAVVLAALVGCGPSVQSIYEGNVRFEHCYRLDLDLEIVPTHRRHCWEQWLESFRYGQPRDRVEYARKRLKLFANGDFDRPVLELAPSPTAGATNLAVTPAPTSVHAPPPSMAGGAKPEPASVVASAAPSNRPAPEAGCVGECDRSLGECRAAVCQDSANGGGGSAGATGVGGPACASCDQDYKSCMRRCFE